MRAFDSEPLTADQHGFGASPASQPIAVYDRERRRVLSSWMKVKTLTADIKPAGSGAGGNSPALRALLMIAADNRDWFSPAPHEKTLTSILGVC